MGKLIIIIPQLIMILKKDLEGKLSKKNIEMVHFIYLNLKFWFHKNRLEK